jgi:hypothetical protein
VADAWQEFNRLYFGGRLKPLPIFLTPSTPYGHCIGWTCGGGPVTHIALADPRKGNVLVADRGVLLHEMIHQFLHESGEYARHDGGPWCREVMRLHRLLTGKDVWAGKYTVTKKRLPDGGRVSVRGNVARPGDGEASLTQKVISRWPYSAGIDLGPL